ncbi:MAG: hypothetical protein P4M00_25240 [Azospirillaceae bacterium]|nr:hypothetical protein [Azospirillaceae bacterium]
MAHDHHNKSRGSVARRGGATLLTILSPVLVAGVLAFPATAVWAQQDNAPPIVLKPDHPGEHGPGAPNAEHGGNPQNQPHGGGGPSAMPGTGGSQNQPRGGGGPSAMPGTGGPQNQPRGGGAQNAPTENRRAQPEMIQPGRGGGNGRGPEEFRGPHPEGPHLGGIPEGHGGAGGPPPGAFGHNPNHFSFREHDIRRFDHDELDHWRGGEWRHERYGGRFGWWWHTGGAWYFYDEPVYPYPPVVSSVIIEEPQPTQQFWYYCDDPQGYYPSVGVCNIPFRAIPIPEQ